MIALKLIMTEGLPGSGKSTWAKKMVDDYPGGFKRINKDDMRAMFDNGKHSKGNENFVLQARDALIFQALNSGYNVIVDDTNLHPKHEARLRAIAAATNPQCIFEVKSFLDVSVEECIRRDANRVNGKVGMGVIMRMYNEFLKPNPPTPYPVDGNLPDCVICDLDGTLAIVGDRNVYDCSNCDVVDTVNEHVMLAVQALASYQGARVIFMSGRQEKDRLPSESFILKAGFNAYDLYMRATKDSRSDDVVKRELFDAHIGGKFNVLAVFDDRPCVVRLWKSMGLPVFNVGDGIEF
jgi:predicted kinase